MTAPQFSRRHLPLFILILSLSGIYLSTLAPGLTWANSGSDGGDLITAAYTGGIAHPTGYPLYLLLARFFQLLPVGSLAYRTNLMSALATVLTAVLIYKLVTQTLDDLGLKHTCFAGLTAGFAFGLAPLVWSQAVITEVYALQAFLTALILYIFVFPVQGWGVKSLERLRGLLPGLAMGNHITSIFLLPLVLISGSGDTPKPTASFLTRQLVWFTIGLSLYLTLPLRAMTNPPINWGNPVTIERFWWLVSGELYRSYYLGFDPGEIWERIQPWASLLLQQFGWLGLVLGIMGLILFYAPTRLYILSIWISLVYSLFAFAYSSDDSYVYLIPVYISFSIWIGLGVGNLLGRISFHPKIVAWGTGLLLIFYLAVRVTIYGGDVDASRDLRAEMFGRQVMSEVPHDALVFVKGDQAVFSLWYFHFAVNERPDLVVIAEELLHFDWYQETLQSTYPTLNVPGPLPWAETVSTANPSRAVCHVQYSNRTEIKCTDPLQSP